MSKLTRRGLLQAFAATAVMSNLGVARASTPEPTSVVLVYLSGGINAIFTGADAFTGNAFGVTANNVTKMGNVVIDNALANAIPTAARNKVASIGIRHGISDHGNAQRSLFASGNQSAPLMLANAIGGNAAIKAAVVGQASLPNGVRPAPVNGISLQPITDMQATIDAIAGAQNAPDLADRSGAARGIAAAQAMSKGVLAQSTQSLTSIDQGLTSAIATLQKPVQPFDSNEFSTAYKLNGTAVSSFTSRMAAAELMVRAGTNVVVAQDDGPWDSHGDSNGTSVRNSMTQRIQPGLKTFLSRMVDGAAVSERNVIVAVFGDFHRSLPGSDHQANVAALLIGKTLKNATTGKTDNRVSLAASTAGVAGLWQCLSAAAKVDAGPFGANPHAVLA